MTNAWSIYRFIFSQWNHSNQTELSLTLFLSWLSSDPGLCIEWGFKCFFREEWSSVLQSSVIHKMGEITQKSDLMQAFQDTCAADVTAHWKVERTLMRLRSRSFKVKAENPTALPLSTPLSTTAWTSVPLLHRLLLLSMSEANYAPALRLGQTNLI